MDGAICLVFTVYSMERENENCSHTFFFLHLFCMFFFVSFWLGVFNIQIIDVPKNRCNDAYAYIPDLGAYGVVVYSFKNEKSWRIKHNFFYFDPVNGDFNVGGVNFQWTDGICGEISRIIHQIVHILLLHVIP